MFKLLQIASEDRLVQSIVVRQRLAIDLNTDLDGAAVNVLPDERLDVRLQRHVAFGHPQVEFEIAVVDRADFGRDGQVVLVRMSFAMAGHAKEQSGESSTKKIG